MSTPTQVLKRVDALSKYVPVSEKEYLKAIQTALDKVIADLRKTEGKWTKRRMNEIVARLRNELKSPTRKWIEAFFDDLLSAIWIDYQKGVTQMGEEIILYEIPKATVKKILGFKEIVFHTQLADGTDKHYMISVDELLKSVDADTVKRVKSIIVSGAVTGANPNDIVRQVGDVYGVEKRHLRTVVRTMMADAQVRVMMEHLEKNQDLFECYEYSAKLDNRTTIICREMDDTIWKEFDDIPDDLKPPLHPNCRSIIIGRMSCA